MDTTLIIALGGRAVDQIGKVTSRVKIFWWKVSPRHIAQHLRKAIVETKTFARQTKPISYLAALFVANHVQPPPSCAAPGRRALHTLLGTSRRRNQGDTLRSSHTHQANNLPQSSRSCQARGA